MFHGTGTDIFVDANASNYFESGSTAYPFKELYSALEFANNSTDLKGCKIHLKAGNYTLYLTSFMKAVIVADEEGVVINGIMNLDTCDFYFGGQPITFNLSQIQISNSKCSFNNAIINYSGNTTPNIQLLSRVLFKNCRAENMGSYFNITDSDVRMDFTAISRATGSAQLLSAGEGSIIFIVSKDTIATTNINRNANAIVLFGGYVNAT